MDKSNWHLKWITSGPESFLNVRFSGVEIKIYLAFLLIVTLGLWPVSSGLLSLKNDEIIYFLPYRYNIVENIRNWQFPLWSPYIYMGFPISGDMQSGAWNPLVWLLATTGRYTLTTLHAELLIYIFFAAIGMFKLMRALEFQPIVCFTIAVSYAFSGFIIDSGQFMCWESCACFLPYTYIYFIRLLQHPGTRVSAKFALANFCLLIAGGYPFFFIANIYFLALGFAVFCIISKGNLEKRKIKRAFICLTISVILFLLLSTAPLLCFANLLPYYSRGTHLPLKAALFNSYSLFSTISLLFPFSITRDHADFGNNNVLSRNLYIGILLLPFVMKGMVTKRTIAWNTTLLCIIFSFALSLGDVLPFRKWAYWWLPLMNTFRHPSNFRLFITVGLLSFAGKGLHEFLSSPLKENRKAIINSFYFILLGALVLGICFLPLKENDPFSDASMTAVALKKILGNISFRQGVLLSLLLQIPFLLGSIFLFKKRKYYYLCALSILNVICLGQPQLLSSTVAKNPVFRINDFIKKQPEGFPITELRAPISFPDERRTFLYEYKEPLEFFFNKKIAINTFINNPTILKTYDAFINDSSLMLLLKTYPFLYEADSVITVNSHIPSESKKCWIQTIKTHSGNQENRSVFLTSFKPNEFEFAVKKNTSGLIVILQNNFPGWEASANNKLLPIETVNKTFMGLNLPAGTYTLHLQYKPGWFLPGMIFSFIGLLIIATLLFNIRFTCRTAFLI